MTGMFFLINLYNMSGLMGSQQFRTFRIILSRCIDPV